MATTFNMLRANDLIWSFVVNNYLLGKEPFPFDLLYWNSDATRMPPAMHSFYLRNMYQKNLLAQPGGLEMKGVPVDLRKVDIPIYFLSCREDHIAPWTSTYRGARLFSGKVRFVLAGSGHIAGVVNPPEGGKYNHFINDSAARHRGCVVRGGDRGGRLLVAGLAALGDRPGPQHGSGAHPGRGAGSDRAGAGVLRPSPLLKRKRGKRRKNFFDIGPEAAETSTGPK